MKQLSLVVVLLFIAASCGTSGSVASSEPATIADPIASVEADSVGTDSVDSDSVESDSARGELNDAETAPSEAPAQTSTVVAEPLSTPRPAATAAPTATVEPLGTPLPRAPIGIEGLVDQEAEGPRPVSLAIDSIDVVDADVIAVGVNPDQTFEVPPAEQVGWYRFGPTPGAEGSAVLAAHIAFDGVDGVFRHLADVEVGAIVTVGFDDGTTAEYRIESLTEYLKEELPASLFARSGDPQLALITCGGQFNRQLSSYESNVVAVAVPV